MASVQIYGRDALAAATELVHKCSQIAAFNLEPDVAETCRIYDPLIVSPARLTEFIKFWFAQSRLEFGIREDVPPADSDNGVVGISI